jgi:hypothetical protein
MPVEVHWGIINCLDQQHKVSEEAFHFNRENVVQNKCHSSKSQRMSFVVTFFIQKVFFILQVKQFKLFNVL